MNPASPARSLRTRRGTVSFPAFFPVTTFGDTFPIDRLIRPYLPRLAPGILVSHHYAAGLVGHPEDRPDAPLFLDSGGFALLLEGSRWEDREWGGPAIITATGDVVDRQAVLLRQLDLAEIGATLDLPIPPGLDPAEAARRQDATIRNAQWALLNAGQRPDLCLYASLQAWDGPSAGAAAAAYAAMRGPADRRFAGIAIGGMVPRLHRPTEIEAIVRAVRAAWDGPIHVFGIGSPEMVRQVLAWGADSTDSSSYVRQAVDGRGIAPGVGSLAEGERTPLAIMRLALRNVAALRDPVGVGLPMGMY